MIEGLAADLRYAARGLRRSPGFTAAAVLTLGLGIGATTAVFSVVYGVIFRPLPFPNADRLVQIVQLRPQRGQAEPLRTGITSDQIAEWRATSRTLSHIGYYGGTSAALTGATTPMRLNGATVTVTLFRALGTEPLKGRLFTEDDELPGNEQVVILSYATWAARFGADDDLLEKPITLNERPFRVIGVMPEGFGFPSLASESMSLNSAGELVEAPEFWIPMVARPRPASPVKSGGMTLVPALALLKPGVTVEQATAEVNTLMPSRVGERFPVELASARVEQAREVRPILLLFQTAVLFVLFIACVNVVNLLLARMAHRRQELAIRQALGASRAQLTRYAVAEGVLIGMAGGAMGCLVAYEVAALFRTLPPFLLPRMADVRVDAVVLGLASGVSIAAGIAVGIVAASRTVRGELQGNWIASASRTVGASRRGRPSRALVAAETAAGIVLLAGAGLLLTSFVKLASVERGFTSENVFMFRVSLPARYKDPVAQYAFHDDLSAALKQIPGVTSVGSSTRLLGQYAIGFTLAIDGQRREAHVAFNFLAPGVFETLRIPLRGRDFTPNDRTQTAAVAIVNETFARQFLAGRDPLGHRILFQSWPALEIVGVAGDTRMGELGTEVSPAVYVPQEFSSATFGAPTYVLRTSTTPALIDAIRTAAVRFERDAVVFDATSMDALLARRVTTPKFYGMTAAGFAAVAVMLAALGLYGVLAYSVGTRTREFGIRIALGARSSTVVSAVMREALAMVAIGIAAGIAAAVYLSRFLEKLLFGVEPTDPRTLIAVAMMFLAIAAVACYVPARRATRVDPVTALRAE